MASIRVHTLSNGRIVYAVLWRDPDTRRQTSYRLDSRGEAENFLRLIEANGGHLDQTMSILDAISRNVPTITELIAEHIDSLSGVTARTRADYRRDAANHIAPHLGWRPADQLNAGHVRDWVRTLAATEMSDKTIANAHGVLSATFETVLKDRDARKRTGVVDNPCRGIRLPRRSDHTSAEMIFLTPAEWATLDAEIGKRDDGWYQLMFRTLYLTGMRWGEMVALQVRDLSFDTDPATIRISRASRRDDHSKAYVGPTKTPRSRRTISIPPALADALAAHVKGRAAGDRVFTSRTGAPVHHSNVRTRVWVPATDAAGLAERPRIHDLRHTHASQQIAAGVDLLTVQRRLGHESLKTTADRYGHLMPAQQTAAADAAARAMTW